MAGDSSSSYQPSFGRRGGVRPRFFAQADGDNDSGSLGTLLSDVSKTVKMNTGFSGVVFEATSKATAATSQHAATSIGATAPSAVLPAKIAVSLSAPSADGSDARDATTAPVDLSFSSASIASERNNGSIDPTISSASAPLRPPTFGRRGGTNFGFDAPSSNIVALQQQTTQLQHLQQPEQQHQYQQQHEQHSQHQQQPVQNMQQQQTNSSSPLQSSLSVSTAPISKFGFKFGGTRPKEPAVAHAPFENASVSAADVRHDNFIGVVAKESMEIHISPPKISSSSSPSNQNSLQRPFVTAHAPSLISSRGNKYKHVDAPAIIDVSSRAAQLMREIGESEDHSAANPSGGGVDYVWRERSSRSVAGDVGSHIMAHAKVDTGLPRDLASRDRARIAIIYKESERNKKAVERLRTQLQEALSSDRVASLENAIVERDRIIESLTRDNKMLQRNFLMQEKELEVKRDIENNVASRVKEKNEDLRIMRERLKKFKELHVEQQKALHSQQQQHQRLQASYDEVRRKLSAALSDPSFDADEARKQLVEKDALIASLERELRIFRHKKESDGRMKGREHKLKDGKMQQLQTAIEEAQLQLAARGREVQAQSLRIKALEEEVHVWQQRARRHSRSIQHEAPNHSKPREAIHVKMSSPSLFLTEGLESVGEGIETQEYRSAITPPSMRQIPLDPSIPRHCLSRLKTPVQTKETQSKAHHVQDSDRNSNLAPRNLSSNSLNSEGADSVDDLAYVSDFEDETEAGKNYENAMASGFHPVPPMQPPKPTSLPATSNNSSRQTIVHAPTNASLARSRYR